MVRINQHAKFQAISSIGFPENAWKPQIWPVSLSQNSTKIRQITGPASKLEKSITCNHNLISSESGQIQQHTIFQAIPSIRFPGNARKPLIWPVPLSQNSAKISKINRLCPETNQFCKCSRYISVQNFRPFPPCFSGKCPEIPILTRFTKSK